MDEDCAKLGLLKPDVEPRATQHIGQIIEMIQQLIDRDYAYVASDGDVLYSVAKFDGLRQAVGQDPRGPARRRARRQWTRRSAIRSISCCGRAAKPNEPFWESPWGRGPAGLAHRVLGDVEGGARRDVRHSRRRPGSQVPASRERDRAELRAPRGAKFVNLWMHNGFVNINNEKMSKSLGNFFTVRDVFAKLRHPEVMRYFLLSSHYRGPINYAPDLLEQADAALESHLHGAARPADGCRGAARRAHEAFPRSDG